MSFRAFFTTAAGELSPRLIILRALVLVLIIGLVFFYLFASFTGLTSEVGMDQAQISRQLARGDKFSTKVIRPLVYFQSEKHMQQSDGDPPTLVGFSDTFHAPLNPLLNSVVLKMFHGDNDYSWKEDTAVYLPDRLIAAVSTLLFLCAIGVNYLLIARIFDGKIAGVTALLMLVCDLMWKFTHTGQPQILLLFLFSFANYFLFKAVENKNTEKGVWTWVLLAAAFYGLMGFANWLTLWMAFGFLIFVAFYFKPRGLMAVASIAVIFAISGIWVLHHLKFTGNILGSGFLMINSGAADFSGDVMRSYGVSSGVDLKGLPSKIFHSSIGQFNNLYGNLGSILAAPLFFLALIHPFKRKDIADFRWPIFASWVFASFGMALFGLPAFLDIELSGIDAAMGNSPLDKLYTHPYQIHILFMPMMTAFGLAFLSILWSRVAISTSSPMLLNAHLILVVLFSAIPLGLLIAKQLPKNITIGSALKSANTNPSLSIARACEAAELDPYQVVVTNSPFEVAWYGDQTALWVPKTESQLAALSLIGAEAGQPIAGFMMESRKFGGATINDLFGSQRLLSSTYLPIVLGRLGSQNEDEAGGRLPFRRFDPEISTASLYFFTE